MKMTGQKPGHKTHYFVSLDVEFQTIGDIV